MHDLGAKDFEKLCNELLRVHTNIDFFEYGSLPEPQYGIDLIGRRDPSSKYTVAQCKKWAAAKISDIKKWVTHDFLEKELAKDTSKYILCTTVDIPKKQSLLNTWYEQEKKLHKAGIEAELWHFERINSLLRKTPDIVGVFFGDDVANRFCPSYASSEYLTSEFKSKTKHQSINGFTLENTTCHLNVIADFKNQFGISGCLTFNNQRLSGIATSIERGRLVSILQESHHSRSIKDTSFISSSIASENFILTLPNTILTLSEKEVDDLDWILKEAWKEYYQIAKEIDKSWQALSFPKITQPDFSYSICKIEKWFWQAVLKYINDHDFQKGEEPDYIFDAAPGCLKVFSNAKNNDLDEGYHLIMYPQVNSDIHSTCIILQWQPLTNIVGQPIECSKRKAWNAEKTHFWLFQHLFPKVLKHVEKQENTRKPLVDRLKTFLNLKTDISFPSDIGWSCKLHKSPKMGYYISTSKDLFNIVATLQNHFSTYTRKAPITPKLIYNTVNSCKTLTEHLPQHYENSYITSAIGLDKGPLSSSLTKYLSEFSYQKEYSVSYLDYCLRGLLEHLKCVKTNQIELEKIATDLNELWNRYIEDLLCDAYN
ncbi:hypothetical protein GCM10011332_31230 [Terasakiella brassicae]|uniref:Restriction endonuclease type IV Mrr domain-containing protein n=1 Tax=Terasakiella brassicae TaxID=1634917 RepID=A0A917C6W1_9PROT|nr:hypothetical protein GCM10011332_31230 [Terasakiella brassicae]